MSGSLCTPAISRRPPNTRSPRRPGGIISLQGGGIIQESLGAIIPF